MDQATVLPRFCHSGWLRPLVSVSPRFDFGLGHSIWTSTHDFGKLLDLFGFDLNTLDDYIRESVFANGNAFTIYMRDHFAISWCCALASWFHRLPGIFLQNISILQSFRLPRRVQNGNKINAICMKLKSKSHLFWVNLFAKLIFEIASMVFIV